MLKTETPAQDHALLDQYPTVELVNALVDDQRTAADAVRVAAPALAAAVTAALPRMEAGGRLVYVGAGTSGRLDLLDSVELYPTFSWPHERAVALLAGGNEAMFVAVEGAEDDLEQGAADLCAAGVNADDVVLLIAASGATPYVLGALRAARELGALTIGFANNVDAPVANEAEIGVTLDTGPEIISGSTRLKAGTAQKIALNTFSSALMVRLNKVYGNLMVDLKATNAKLVQRAIRLTAFATGADEAAARAVLEECDFHVKTAIVALSRQTGVEQAKALLEATHGSVRLALAG
ncbi:N-acetylmuramic acid 6-phosphate etherase [Massilia sp. Dwa41.01b]|uniref:N-acetylmuramic acid 6-phosphate etherase n=1 Tax=Massilia sp. Dwa41.01b TaxID=2709302 RepID=UPI0015FF19D4|nr:N-acetylmuramic acid 6-phosphate etherase [Massilia sp. Dwa41.01b]QNA87346.1 N-acetylmuramic acid 6-phosphate etherase [Massilia sp. Dwa41.01b]